MSVLDHPEQDDPLALIHRYLDEDEDDAENEAPNDGKTIRDTLIIYGGIFVFCMIIFCCVRRRYPRTFQVRHVNPKYKCDLAKEQYGFLNWVYLMTIINEDDIMDQCGLDALCFLRILSFGCKVSLVGVVNSVWLFPIYATAPSSEETENVDDKLAKLSATNVPSSNARLIATAVASWIIFGFTMRLILKDFEWFTRKRHLFLSRTWARNYTIYIKGISYELRNSAALLRYFQDCFGKDSVLEAHVALDIPNLEKKIAKRDAVLFNLEHAITLKHITDKEPTHKSSLVGGETLNSIEAYTEELRTLNDEVSLDIMTIMAKHDPEVLRRKEEGDDREIPENLETDDLLLYGGVSGASDVSVASDVSGQNSKMNASVISSIADESAYGKALAQKEKEAAESKLAALDDEPQDHDEPQDQPEQERLESVELDDEEAALPVENSSTKKKKSGVTSMKKAMTKVSQSGAAGLKKSAVGVKGVGGAAMNLLTSDEDGKERESGFVTFKNLTTTQAALQMVHSSKPFVMHTSEAPAAHDVFWASVGKTHEKIKSGELTSLCLTVALCLFWTIPVTFVASLTEVDALKENIDFLADWLDAWPFLEEIFAQLAPLLIVGLNFILPYILWGISMLELPISTSILETSTFVKLSIFMIIQTFFVSAISGSVFTAIDTIIDDPTEAIDIIARALSEQAIYFVQILLVGTFLGLSFELLNIGRVLVAKIRSWVGPNASQKERDMVWMGLISLVEPWELMYGFILGKAVLYYMVTFVYSSMVPITNYFLALCYTLLNIGWRHQLIYIYPPNKDSGGRLWTGFISITITCMIIAEVVLAAWFGIKKAPVAAGLTIPLIIITIIFNSYIRQQHFVVAERLPTAECVDLDYKNMPLDYSFVKGLYQQEALRAADAEPYNAKEILYLDAEGDPLKGTEDTMEQNVNDGED